MDGRSSGEYTPSFSTSVRLFASPRELRSIRESATSPAERSCASGRLVIERRSTLFDTVARTLAAVLTRHLHRKTVFVRHWGTSSAPVLQNVGKRAAFANTLCLRKEYRPWYVVRKEQWAS